MLCAQRVPTGCLPLPCLPSCGRLGYCPPVGYLPPMGYPTGRAHRGQYCPPVGYLPPMGYPTGRAHRGQVGGSKRKGGRALRAVPPLTFRRKVSGREGCRLPHG
uniref:Uncharacterized protein n=1 Tax=Udotea flabellum TaxID=170437 RepID=A0A386B1U9_9CHLO|nr:hypothetical protein [Udotea flabellum]AYC65686.1 hypothetical protein [Udotea flabellum]